MNADAAARIRADIATDLRERARLQLAHAIRHGGEHHRRMHRALIRQAWNVAGVHVDRAHVPARPLSYRAETL